MKLAISLNPTAEKLISAIKMDEVDSSTIIFSRFIVAMAFMVIGILGIVPFAYHAWLLVDDPAHRALQGFTGVYISIFLMILLPAGIEMLTQLLEEDAN